MSIGRVVAYYAQPACALSAEIYKTAHLSLAENVYMQRHRDNVYMYLCMYISIYVCMSVCMYVCVHVCMYLDHEKLS